jgi:hypothetical protein
MIKRSSTVAALEAGISEQIDSKKRNMPLLKEQLKMKRLEIDRITNEYK